MGLSPAAAVAAECHSIFVFRRPLASAPCGKWNPNAALCPGGCISPMPTEHLTRASGSRNRNNISLDIMYLAAAESHIIRE